MINRITSTLFQNILDPDSGEFDQGQESPLYGKRILFVMGGYEGKLSFYERGYDLGIQMVVMDGAGHWAKDYVERGLFEAFIEVDFGSEHDTLDAVLEVLLDSGLSFDGVATFADHATSLTSRLAFAMGLPGYPIAATTASRNKYATRQRCAAAGLPTPRFSSVNSAADLEQAAEWVGFPAVLKPMKGVASADVYFIADKEALLARFEQLERERRGKTQRSSLNSNNASTVDLVWVDGFDLLLEEYLDGDEFDIDCLLSRGELVFFSVTGEDPQPNMIETGGSLPARYPAEKQTELVELAREVLAVLGFTDGVFHVEAKYTSHGARLLEVNARLGGGPVYQMVKWVWGVDMVEQYLLTCIGLPIQPHKAETPLTYLALRDLVVPYSGLVTRDDFLDPLCDDGRVRLLKTYVKTGQNVIGPDRGVPEWLGEIIVSGESSEVAYQTLEALVAEIELPIQRSEIYA